MKDSSDHARHRNILHACCSGIVYVLLVAANDLIIPVFIALHNIICARIYNGCHTMMAIQAIKSRCRGYVPPALSFLLRPY